MRLLLDTHVFLWWRADPRQLTAEAKRAIAGSEVVLISAVSVWEMVIKAALGKLRIPEGVEQGVEDSGFQGLPIELRHAAAVGDLPPHHTDPFDRMLIAQAQVEGLTLVTRDRSFAAYRVPILWT